MWCMEQMGQEEICSACQKAKSDDVPPHHLKPGTILNKKFLVGHALGEGGFGITYIGYDLNLKMKVAIKEYYPNGHVNRNNASSGAVFCRATEADREFFDKGRNKFLDEARILARFSGELGIVDVRDYFEENETAYIVMEYLEGLTLKEYLQQNGRMPVNQAIDLLAPIIAVLERIHQQGLIHRDISPDNIMLVNGKVKLLDFGAARDVSVAANKSLSVMLKPGYAPEEQYRRKGIQGPWTDVYSLCATLYKCITNVTPDDATERVYCDELKAPSVLGVEVSSEVEAAILKGLGVLREDRYQSVAALWEGLHGKCMQIEEDLITVVPASAFQREQPAMKTQDKQVTAEERTVMCEAEVTRTQLLLDGGFSHDADLSSALENFRQDRFEQAFHAFAQLAEENNAKAQLMLARMYAHGLGTEQSADHADFWYRSAVKLGDAEAQYAYGVILTDECDEKQKKKKTQWVKGMDLLKDAADRGYSAAMEKYIKESRHEFSGLGNIRRAIGYCDQLIKRSNGEYERAKYAKAKEELKLRQVKIAGKTIEMTIVTICYAIGVIVGVVGALYLLVGVLPDLCATSALLGKLPAVTEEVLVPIKPYWDWVLTFLNVAGAFGLELILIGGLIRVAVKDRQTLKFSVIVRNLSLAAYAGILIWYFKAYASVGDVFSEENLGKMLLVLATILVSSAAGYVLGAITSYFISVVLPIEKQSAVESTE